MPEPSNIENRKADHIRINLEEDVRSGLSTGLERYRFVHEALPEIDLEAVDCGLELFGRKLETPLLISSMTGGTKNAAAINRGLAEAAQEAKVALGVGSQRAALENETLRESFRVRAYAPNALIFGNLGAVQLNYGYSVDDCRRAVELLEADGLFLHLNSLQEAVQPEGETRFSGLAEKIAEVCRALDVPVIVKEVGWGISERTARLLSEAGVAAIDVAGAGGTSWSQVEKFRVSDPGLARVAGAFDRWGIPTAESIIRVRQAVPGMKILASGGLRDGVDVAKCIALGAELGGMAGPFLKAAVTGVEDVLKMIAEIRAQIRICMFGTGSQNLAELKTKPMIHQGVE